MSNVIKVLFGKEEENNIKKQEIAINSMKNQEDLRKNALVLKQLLAPSIIFHENGVPDMVASSIKLMERWGDRGPRILASDLECLTKEIYEYMEKNDNKYINDNVVFWNVPFEDEKFQAKNEDTLHFLLRKA